MAARAAELKQTFCFKSLRLLEKRDSLGYSLKSFSDSEIINGDNCEKLKLKTKAKSNSENCLNICLTKTGIKDTVAKKAMSKLFNLCEENNSHDTSMDVLLNNNIITNSYSNVTSNSLDENESINVNTKTRVHLATNKTISATNETENFISRNNPENVCGGNKTNFPNQGKILAEALNKIISKANNSVEMQRVTTDFKKSSPYRILVDGVNNENILGEPRCLTLKKCSGEINPFLTDDTLHFEPDFEEDNNTFLENVTRTERRNRKSSGRISDMFQDEDEDKPYKKKTQITEREEGELSPDVHLPSSNTKKIDETTSKPNAEFFNKINECLRDLDKKCKDIYSSSTPAHSIKHLQSTLSNVDSIKRKLTFLISSKNGGIEKRNKLKKASGKYSSSKSSSFTNNTSHIHSKSERNSLPDNSSSARLDDYLAKHRKASSKDFNDSENVNDLYLETNEKADASRENNESENYLKQLLRHRGRSGRDKPSQTDLFNRKKVSILEKLGTKKEIQRIQSLFKRQMNLITQHVIQKKETKSHHTHKYESERSRKRHSSQKQDVRNIDKMHEKISLDNLETLEDMEDFLNSLKSKANDKILYEEYIDDEKRKGGLIFTSKKKKTYKLNEPSNQLLLPKTSTEMSNNSKVEVFKMPFSKEDHKVVFPHENQNTLIETNKTKQKAFDVTTKDIKLTSKSKNYSLPENHKQLLESDSRTPTSNPSSKTITVEVKNQKEAENRIEENKIREVKKINHNRKQEESSSENNKSYSSLEKLESDISERVEQYSKHSDFSNTSETNKQKGNKRKREEHLDTKYNESESEMKRHILKTKNISEQDGFLGKENKETLMNIPERDISLESEKTLNTDESLMRNLLTKKILILDDNNLAMNNDFCLKVIGNEVYLKKLSSKRKRKHHRISKSNRTIKKYSEKHANSEKTSNQIENDDMKIENVDAALEEMENFLQDLRSKKKVSDDEQQNLIETNPQAREMKFLARIQAKRKAKLMACVSGDADSTEKEAKFLKALEKRDKDVSDSPDIETRKQKLIEKIRAETDAIVLAQKPIAKSVADDDPLVDVKTFLNLIKEAEANNDENSKQDYVSFSLKRSDVNKLENLTAGKASSLTEESQKLLNSVRAKMRAKKTPATNISSLMLKPEL